MSLTYATAQTHEIIDDLKRRNHQINLRRHLDRIDTTVREAIRDRDFQSVSDLNQVAATIRKQLRDNPNDSF